MDCQSIKCLDCFYYHTNFYYFDVFGDQFDAGFRLDGKIVFLYEDKNGCLREKISGELFVSGWVKRVVFTFQSTLRLTRSLKPVLPPLKKFLMHKFFCKLKCATSKHFILLYRYPFIPSILSQVSHILNMSS